MEGLARKSDWTSHKSVRKFPGSYSENRHMFFKPSPASNVSSSLLGTSKERTFFVDSGASLHMINKSDSAPEDQEMIYKSKGPPVIVTAIGTTHTTKEATVCVCDLDMFVEVQVLKESPAVLSLGNLCEERGCSYEWHPGQPSFLI